MDWGKSDNEFKGKGRGGGHAKKAHHQKNEGIEEKHFRNKASGTTPACQGKLGKIVMCRAAMRGETSAEREKNRHGPSISVQKRDRCFRECT